MTTEAKNHIDEKIRRQLSARGIDEPTEADIHLIRGIWEGVGGWEEPTSEALQQRQASDLAMERHVRQLTIERLLRKHSARVELFAGIFGSYRGTARAAAIGFS